MTAACLAKAGHEVIGVDINEDKLNLLASGRSPIVEHGLDALLADVTGSKRLTVTSSTADAISRSDVALICVGTPSDRRGRLSLDAVERAAQEIGRALRGRTEPFTLVVRSTVLPGVTERIVMPALRAEAGPEASALVRYAMNPEFMREGSSLRDFAQPPCTVVGTPSDDAANVLRGLYSAVNAPFIHTSIRTAELAKYVSNLYHALKVTFGNEIGDLCEEFEVDNRELLRVFFADRKLNISEAYLRPGFAFGGSCLPKDLRAILAAARDADLPLPLLSSVIPANENQVTRAVRAVVDTGRRRIGVVGLAFKPGTDDLRESPMVSLIETLIGKGYDVKVLDQNVSIARLIGTNRRYIEEQIPHVASLMCDTVEQLLEHAEVLICGSACEDMLKALEGAGPHQQVIDLTRGQIRTPARVAEVPA
ncbi:MAG TPA: nucleotide sugar dehydrogenase [Vicinamibacterales bacterium]